ncbi:MAG: polysaccharide deacetylase family protein [Chitinophagales bacterium]
MKCLIKNIFCVVLFTLTPAFVFAKKEIAITIDDPHTKETPLLNWQQRNDAILNILDKHKIQAALFVCGMRVDNANGISLLNQWDKKKHLICNHSYSHLYFNSASKTCDIFIADFKKGDSIIRHYKNYTKLFRFPYLKEGNSAAKRDSMRTAMKTEGYKNGYVSIDASDWYIDAQIALALKKDINTDLTPYKEYYIQHILDRAKYYDSLAHLVFKRDIKHTLLIHHSLLNALFLDDLLTALEANGWKLIDAKKAFKDTVYLQQPLIEPCGESVVWQCAEQTEALSKDLRYPGEDEEYEKEPLEQYLLNYTSRTKIK